MTRTEPFGYAHDLGLPAWGPYSKRYAGISHVADQERGARFDLTVVPGYFRGDLVVPDGLRPSRFHPWEAAPGLSHYTYRYELEWKDQVYCDVSFTALGASTRLISCEWVNTTEYTQRVVSHMVTSLDFASIGSHREWLRTVNLRRPPGVIWVDALDYEEIHLGRARADGGLAADGMLLGEVRAHGTVGGSVLAGVGQDRDDAAVYSMVLPKVLRDAVLRLRYRLPVGVTAELVLEGPRSIRLGCRGEGAMRTVDIDLGRVDQGSQRIAVGLSGAALSGLEIDGFMIGEREDVRQTTAVSTSLATDIEVTPGPGGGFVLDPQALDRTYGVAWAGEELSVREFQGEDLDLLLRGAKYDWNGVPSPSERAEGIGESAGRFTSIVPRPMTLPAHSRRTSHGLVCEGALHEVADQLAEFGGTSSRELQQLLDDGRRATFAPSSPAKVTGERQKLLDSQRRMAATVLTNVVYPIYMRRQYIRHFAPGRWWDSLYTWDSGMIGLGLTEIDPASAEDCLEAYLTGPGDLHSAFIHHGTTVPTQQYLAAELLARGGRKRFAHWYPGLREQYRFLAGEHPESQTRMPTGLLNPFAYFYNSGGWDDYPAQVATHRRCLAESVSPMVTTSHVIRVAKLLLLATAEPTEGTSGPSGYARGALPGLSAMGGVTWPETVREDVAGYAEDIERMSSAVQQCWDPEAGYFGYARHTSEGAFAGILRDDDGVNLNMGLDGVYPLVAGVCAPSHIESLLEKLYSPDHLWTDIGFSTVDRSAPYFTRDGYWNGQVWVAHQWFLFKAMLDLGRAELAGRIAEAVLEVWAAETQRTYNTWEHFSIATGRGNGWHQFGGLSAPVLKLFAAYHRTGTLTTGFDTRILHSSGDDAGTWATADMLSLPSATGTASAVLALAPGLRYEAFVDGEPVRLEEPEEGTVHITWSASRKAEHPLAVARRFLQVSPIR